jgi:hypothetical protein
MATEIFQPLIEIIFIESASENRIFHTKTQLKDIRL